MRKTFSVSLILYTNLSLEVITNKATIKQIQYQACLYIVEL